jgi:hypothetical protein
MAGALAGAPAKAEAAKAALMAGMSKVFNFMQFVVFGCCLGTGSHDARSFCDEQNKRISCITDARN